MTLPTISRRFKTAVTAVSSHLRRFFFLIRQFEHSHYILSRLKTRATFLCPIANTVLSVATMVQKLYVTYNQVSPSFFPLASVCRQHEWLANHLGCYFNQVHKLCQEAAERLLSEFQPQLMIAIGGGGYVPARILRSFLKKPGSPNIPIQAIGLSLYEALPDTMQPGTPGEVETAGTRVTRTQWLDLSSLGGMENLVGKRILIVDEVDDTRTTLEYAVKELQKDVQAASERMGYKGEPTQFSIFVLHVCITFISVVLGQMYRFFTRRIIWENTDNEALFLYFL